MKGLQSLTNILMKIFTTGFYRAHAGILAVGFFVMFGMVEPGQLLNYHKTLMLAFVSNPLMMAVVFAIWLIYTIKGWHYVIGQISAVNQQFLFYSSNAFEKRQQYTGWFITQLTVLLPILIYGLRAVGGGVAHHYYLIPCAVSISLFLLCGISAVGSAAGRPKLIDG